MNNHTKKSSRVYPASIRKNKGKKYNAFDVFLIIFLGIVSLIAVTPFYVVVITSFASEKSILMNGYALWPEAFSLKAYEYVLGPTSTVYSSYLVTIVITVCGTIGGLIVTSLYAYVCSRRNLKYSNRLSIIAYIPVVFNGGMVSFYMVLVNLRFQNSIWGLIIPMLVAPMNVFLMKNYFLGLPESVVESAKIDGASPSRIYAKIIMPMSTPVIATVGLFIALQYWNEWFLPLLLVSDSKLYPLQFLLRQIMARVSYSQSQSAGVMTAGSMPQESLKMATVVVTIGPIIFLYPFVQRFFVKGITIGAVKG